jgi:hypothetical protein
MRTRGPIVTLLAVVVLAFALLAANMFGGGERGASADARSAKSTARSAASTPAALTAAPPSAPAAFPTQASFAGRTTGHRPGEATVEIAVQDGTAVGYVCDGRKLESWLQGSVSGSSLTLRGKGGSELTAELRPAASSGGLSLTGAVRLASGKWSFTANLGQALNAEKRLATVAGQPPAAQRPVPNPLPNPAAPAPPVGSDNSASISAASSSGGY